MLGGFGRHVKIGGGGNLAPLMRNRVKKGVTKSSCLKTVKIYSLIFLVLSVAEVAGHFCVITIIYVDIFLPI